MRRGQFPRHAKDGARLGDISQREVFLDSASIDFARKATVRKQRLDLGAENQLSVRQERVMQRLDPETVAREKQRLPIAVPKCEREHPSKSLHACGAPRLPSVYDYLGIALGVEYMTERGQLGNQLHEVIDFPVEDDDDAAILVVKRLLTGCDVNDRQPAMTEANSGLDMVTAVIRSSVVLRLVHPREN